MKLANYLVFVLIVVIFASGCVQEKTASFSDILDNPKSFDDKDVTLSGVIIKYEGMFFGPEYNLAESGALKVFDDRFNVSGAEKIAIFPKTSSIDPSKYVGYTFDGRAYALRSSKPVVVKGTIRYIGPADDAPEFSLEVESITVELDY